MDARIPAKFKTYCIERVLAAIESATGNAFCIHLIARLHDRIDEGRLASSARLILISEPAFRCAFTEGWLQPYWKLQTSIDEDEIFQFVETQDEAGALQEIVGARLDARSGCGVKVYLVRASSDTICVKLNHKVGDGQTCKQFLYRLAETYCRLTTDPTYAPPLQIHEDRSVMQISSRLPPGEQNKILDEARSKITEQIKPNEWRLPAATRPTSEPTTRFAARQIDAERLTAITQYARANGVSINTVLLAAFARAAERVISRSAGHQAHIMQTVDLRRHLQGPDQPYHCNLSSMITLTLNQSPADPLEKYVAGLGAQMQAFRQDYIGLSHPLVRWELNKKRRFLFNCIPFRVIKRMTQRRIRKLEQTGSPCRLVLSHVGRFEIDRLMFGGVACKEAFIVAGVLVNREMLLVLVNQCGGGMQWNCTYSPRHVEASTIERFLTEMIAQLPCGS